MILRRRELEKKTLNWKKYIKSLIHTDTATEIIVKIVNSKIDNKMKEEERKSHKINN